MVGRFERRDVQRAMGNVVNKKIKIIKMEKWREEINKKGGIDIYCKCLRVVHTPLFASADGAWSLILMPMRRGSLWTPTGSIISTG